MKGHDLDARLEENTNVFLYFFLEQIRGNMTRVKTGISIDGRKGEGDRSVYVMVHKRNIEKREKR